MKFMARTVVPDDCCVQYKVAVISVAYFLCHKSGIKKCFRHAKRLAFFVHISTQKCSRISPVAMDLDPLEYFHKWHRTHGMQLGISFPFIVVSFFLFQLHQIKLALQSCQIQVNNLRLALEIFSAHLNQATNFVESLQSQYVLVFKLKM